MHKQAAIQKRDTSRSRNRSVTERVQADLRRQQFSPYGRKGPGQLQNKHAKD